MSNHILGGSLGQHQALPTPQQAMTPYTGPKYDGMPAPPSPKEIIAALRQQPEVMLFLRELRVTSYHWVGERAEGLEPITGGGMEKFDEAKYDCEMILQLEAGPLSDVRRMHIIDALGAIVWSKAKPIPAVESATA